MDSTTFNFSGSDGNPRLPISAFSTYSLLRNYNFLSSSTQDFHLRPFRGPGHPSDLALQSPSSEDAGYPNADPDKSYLPSKSFLSSTPLFGYSPHLHLLQNEQINSRSTNVVSPCSSVYGVNLRRHRGEKKPIPEEQKDDKYFERRRRNNQAAKKSRDARKMREDQVALRATILEHENAILRAQVLTLREEASSLRQMLLQKKAMEIVSRDNQISIS